MLLRIAPPHLLFKGRTLELKRTVALCFDVDKVTARGDEIEEAVMEKGRSGRLVFVRTKPGNVYG